MRTTSVGILPRVLILDTGPLWELILYSAVHNLYFKRLEPELRFVRTALEYRRLTEFISSFPRRTTTPHVVAEISRKTRGTERKGHAQIWGIVYEEFRQMRMDEELVKLLSMPRDLVAKMGVVDVSIRDLGLRLASTQPLVLSVDSALVSECQKQRVEVRLLSEVISGLNP